jgi:hypothetical protein
MGYLLRSLPLTLCLSSREGSEDEDMSADRFFLLSGEPPGLVEVKEWDDDEDAKGMVTEVIGVGV